jgi:uncharacterized protein (TIGR03435 family)
MKVFVVQQTTPREAGEAEGDATGGRSRSYGRETEGKLIMRAAAILLVAAASVFAESGPRFEAADVHLSESAMNPYTLISGGVLRGTRYDLRKVTMLDLIRIAYDVSPEMVVGGPSWLEFDRFDIAAKAPANTPPVTLHLMLQSLLAERFGLVMHHDTRPMPAYVLAAGKGKQKLTPPDGTANAECQRQTAAATFTAWACRNMTMKAFVDWLHLMVSDYLTEPVVDSTSLEGGWDFDLNWNPRWQVLQAGAERATVFDAVEKQLGLSLVLQDAPAPVIVVDRVNETPTPNAPDIAQTLPPRQLEFELADLKPSPPDRKGDTWFRVLPGGQLDIGGVQMRILLLYAWDIDASHPERFANMPKWTESAAFDIHAKPPAEMNGPPIRGLGYPDDETRLMLRTLLADRFKIQWHYEDRMVDAFSLAAGRVKMQPGDASKRANCKTARSVPKDPRDINPLLSELLRCQNLTMAQFAEKLQELEPGDFSYPVDDATGLSGTWDFLLSFSPRWLVGQKNADGTPNGAIPIDEAISGQLGLKLEKRRRVLPVIVIDHMEEKPTEN